MAELRDPALGGAAPACSVKEWKGGTWVTGVSSMGDALLPQCQVGRRRLNSELNRPPTPKKEMGYDTLPTRVRGEGPGLLGGGEGFEEGLGGR